MIREVMKDIRIVLLSKRVRFCESGRRINRTLWLVVNILPNLYNIICKWFYSPDTKSFCFGSVLNPDSSIHMNCSDSPWIFAICGLCFVEDTFVNH